MLTQEDLDNYCRKAIYEVLEMESHKFHSL